MAKGENITQRTFELAVRIVKLAHVIARKSYIGQRIASQIIGAGTSVGANVEEAQAAESKADFIHKYRIALKEVRETKYWLRLVVSSYLIDNKRVASLLTEVDEISKIIAKIIINTKKKE